ncbi:hypothetical protein QBC39DRAFT_436252 [Podospora conica]|nr:hypothetical protein QBC39DRAFT_436252 [Schizothecium conicum]
MSDLPDFSDVVQSSTHGDLDAEDDTGSIARTREANPYQPNTIFWAVQEGDLQAVNALFNGGFAEPWKLKEDCYYVSPILRSRLQDLAALGDLGGPGPFRITDNLTREFLRENTVILNMPTIPKHEDSFEDRDSVTKGKLQMRRPPHGFCSLDDMIGRKIVGRVVKEGSPITWAHHYGASWWGPLHLAALLGHTEIVDKLLDEQHGIEDFARGLCDCLMPSHLLATPNGKEDTVGGTLSDPRPDWTPLHYAICGGHISTAKLLVERGASEMVGRSFNVKNWPGPSPAHEISGRDWERPTWPALHSAARTDMYMCDYLLDAFPTSIDLESIVWRNGLHPTPAPIRSTAVIQAAAAGQIRTAGRYLLDRGARFAIPGYTDQELRDPLRVLCAIGRLEDAVWLTEFLLGLWVGGDRPHLEGPTRQMRRSVEACLGILERRKKGGLLVEGGGDWPFASARERQGRWAGGIASAGADEGRGMVDGGSCREEDVQMYFREQVLCFTIKYINLVRDKLLHQGHFPPSLVDWALTLVRSIYQL